jgi:RNase P/RNase MRP subunit p30
MRRAYADLHLCVNLNNFEQVSQAVNKASALGYSLVAVPLPPRLAEAQVQQLQRVCEEAGIELASRVDLRPRTTEELLSDLRRLRRRFEIVAVMCESKNVARQAAKDRRVDLLNFPLSSFHRRFFDSSEAELASNSLASFEMDIAPLLILEGVARIKLLSSLRREAATAKEFHVPIVISSGVTSELLMRKPMELAALASLFDLSGISAIEAVSKNPVSIIKRNREKLGFRFVAPGIRVIRRGRDC